MRLTLDQYRRLLISLAPHLHQQQQEIIDCLPYDNRVLREQPGNQRLPPNNDQREPHFPPQKGHRKLRGAYALAPLGGSMRKLQMEGLHWKGSKMSF